MSQIEATARGPKGPLVPHIGTTLRLVLRLGALAALDAFALWFLIQLISDKVWFLALAIGVVTLGLNVFFLREDLYPFRWFSPGLALMIIMVAYPTIFTIYVAFTNYRDGNLLRQYQVIDQIEREQFLPEGAMLYSWTAYQNQDGTLGLWLVGDDGQTIRFVSEDGAVRDVDLADPDLGELDDKGIPASVGDYQKLSVFNVPSDIQTRTFGDSEEPYKVTTPYKAGHYEQRYVYSAADETMTDQQTGTVYTAVQGTFTSPEGETLKPGYYVTIGLDNFKRLVNSRAIRGPFIQVFAWTIAHAFLTVLLTFALGLGLALVLNDPIIPVRKIFRSLILIPYAIPAFISVLVWRGLLNPELGVISTTLRDIFGSAPAWFADPTWAKVGILLIQLWLGFPYMMIICTGALQSIPSDIYEAAEVDGANPWQRFWNITLPLLLISVGPLLIASFAFNFNNFTIIRLYAKGGPPIPDTTTPAGHTDILITYTYRLAFASQRGADYGFATSITIVIFLLVAAITFFNFRFTRVWEEVSESV